MISPFALSFFVLLGLSFVAEALLNRGSAVAQAIGGAGGTYTTDILTMDRTLLVIQADMTAAVLGDLAVIVTPFETDQNTLAVGLNIDPARSKGPIFSTSAKFYGEYDVSGVDKVRVTVTNNNAGAQTINRLSWRLVG